MGKVKSEFERKKYYTQRVDAKIHFADAKFCKDLQRLQKIAKDCKRLQKIFGAYLHSRRYYVRSSMA